MRYSALGLYRMVRKAHWTRPKEKVVCFDPTGCAPPAFLLFRSFPDGPSACGSFPRNRGPIQSKGGRRKPGPRTDGDEGLVARFLNAFATGRSGLLCHGGVCGCDRRGATFVGGQTRSPLTLKRGRWCIPEGANSSGGPVVGRLRGAIGRPGCELVLRTARRREAPWRAMPESIVSATGSWFGNDRPARFNGGFYWFFVRERPTLDW